MSPKTVSYVPKQNSPKGEGRVYLIFFPLLMGEGAQRAGEGGSLAVRDMFFISTTSEFGINTFTRAFRFRPD